MKERHLDKTLRKNVEQLALISPGSLHPLINVVKTFVLYDYWSFYDYALFLRITSNATKVVGKGASSSTTL